jgi:CMP/dCMP kinase
MIVAIDGPSAAGKGTLARAIAKHLGYHFLDTGSLYRMVGHAMLQAGKSADDRDAAVGFAKGLDPAKIREAELRSEEVAAMSSRIAAIPEVRKALMDYQRQFSKRAPGAVLDGRDIGTVICPDAELKFFVTAASDVRARRRFEELKRKGEAVTYEDILADVMARDERDAERTKMADDAIMIDTSELDADEVLAAVMGVIAEHSET